MGGTVAGLLLAAGSASRFGGPKLLVEIDGMPLVRRAARAIVEAGAALTVVTGAYAQQVRAALTGIDAGFVHNEAWEQGMGGSIACGVRELSGCAAPPAACLLCLADQPLVGARELRLLLDTYRAAPLRIVASAYGGTLGPPCVFPSEFFAELARLEGAKGARGVLEAHRRLVTGLALPEAATDIDLPADCDAVMELLSKPDRA